MCEQPSFCLCTPDSNVRRLWHDNDPVDTIETQRNNVIYTDWQHNRNPFIDHPEWVGQISDF